MMRRFVLAARSAPPLAPLLLRRVPQRALAMAGTKDTTPPSPVERSQEQAHPIGPFYESVLRTPKQPAKKPELPPKTAPGAAQAAAAATTAKAPEAPKQSADAPKERGAGPEQEASSRTARAKATEEPPAKPGRPTQDTTTTTTSSTSASTPTAAAASTTAPKSVAPGGEPTPASTQDRARVIFGSRLAGPTERAERLAAIRQRSRIVAGVTVPPRPEEPDNCCMSGCVNCVWDRYRDEIEAWAAARAEADKRLSSVRDETVGQMEDDARGGRPEGGPAAGWQASKSTKAGKGDAVLMGRAATPSHSESAASSMDDDGGGLFADWERPTLPHQSGEPRSELWDEDLYKHVPVGIREFMKQEKVLKEKHLREGTRGG